MSRRWQFSLFHQLLIFPLLEKKKKFGDIYFLKIRQSEIYIESLHKKEKNILLTIVSWYWPIKNFVALNNSTVLMSGWSFPLYFNALRC